MAKVALLNDIHIGARNNSQIFADYFAKFYNNVFFPYLEEHGIKHAVILGDVFDIRKYVNLHAADRANREIIKRFSDMGIENWWIIGNHDSYFKADNSINSMRSLYGGREYPGMHIVDQIREVQIESCLILMVPWIASGNLVESSKAIKKTKAEIMFAHLELAGFEMYKGSFVEHGADHSQFKKFDKVVSGHYHHRSSRENIHYLGTQFEITWADYDDQKGFHIFDTETRELQFVPNPYKIFHKVYYDDTKAKSLEEVLSKLEVEKYAGCYVKLVVSGKANPYWFDVFFDTLEKSELVNLQITDETAVLYTAMYENQDGIDDTVTILNNYIEGLELDTNKATLETLMKTLYEEANNLVEQR